MVVGFAMGVTVCGVALADDSPRGEFLSLGDSIAFGFNPLVTGVDMADPDNYAGYPEFVAREGHNSVDNAGCPGETSSSFLSATAPDNGCREWKYYFGLHADYETTQIEFAQAFVAAHPNLEYIAIDIGANDIFVLQKACKYDPACVEAGLPATFYQYYVNLVTIYTTLRAAGFTGQFVGVTIYALDYTDAYSLPVITNLNNILKKVTAAFGGVIADGFEVFRQHTEDYGGDSCAAGLLIELPDGTCDIHPNHRGQHRLAQAVLGAVDRP